MVIKTANSPEEPAEIRTFPPEDSEPETKPSDAEDATAVLNEVPDEETVKSDTVGASLIGDLLESTLPADDFTVYSEGFYYAPLSDNLIKYMTGNSFPLNDAGQSAVISYGDLRYVHILHFDFDGNPAEGELICNKAIAQDLVEIFEELYRNAYPIEKMVLIDEYFGDDTASMEDNNSSCFNYRANASSGTHSLSLHAYGLAIDINPLYNPYISTSANGTQTVLPKSGTLYIDRTKDFAYKIDEEDLCRKLFTAHGFVWGGSWSGAKDYQHFEKSLQ